MSPANQVHEVVRACDPAIRLDRHYALLEQALPTPRPDDHLPVGVLGGYALPQVPLSNIEVIAGGRAPGGDDRRDRRRRNQGPRLCPDQAGEYLGERL